MGFPTLMCADGGWVFALDVTRGHYAPRRKICHPSKRFTLKLMGFPTLMGSDGGWVFAMDVTRGTL